MIHLFSASHSIKSLSGENLIKCKGFVNTILKCCAITGNRSTTIESQCLQNGSWTPVELNCVPNEGNFLKGIFNKTVMGYGFTRLHPLSTYFLLLVTHRAKCSKMVQNCIFPIFFSEWKHHIWGALPVKFRCSEKHTKFEKIFH